MQGRWQFGVQFAGNSRQFGADFGNSGLARGNAGGFREGFRDLFGNSAPETSAIIILERATAGVADPERVVLEFSPALLSAPCWAVDGLVALRRVRTAGSCRRGEAPQRASCPYGGAAGQVRNLDQ